MNKRNYKREESLTQTAARLEIGIYNCVPLWLVTTECAVAVCVLEHTRHNFRFKKYSISRKQRMFTQTARGSLLDCDVITLFLAVKITRFDNFTLNWTKIWIG